MHSLHAQVNHAVFDSNVVVKSDFQTFCFTTFLSGGEWKPDPQKEGKSSMDVKDNSNQTNRQ